MKALSRKCTAFLTDGRTRQHRVMDDSLLPFTSLRENLIQAYLDFSYFRTTEQKLLRLCARRHSQTCDTPLGRAIYFINKPAFVRQLTKHFHTDDPCHACDHFRQRKCPPDCVKSPKMKHPCQWYQQKHLPQHNDKDACLHTGNSLQI